MAEADPLFSLDVVQDFMLANNGKVKNHQLVTHFRSFLNDPKRKAVHREKFKHFVNTLATVKLDESGEKLLVLKRKYRDTSGGGESQTSHRKPSHKSHGPSRNPKLSKNVFEKFEQSGIEAETPCPAKPAADVVPPADSATEQVAAQSEPEEKFSEPAEESDEFVLAPTPGPDASESLLNPSELIDISVTPATPEPESNVSAPSLEEESVVLPPEPPQPPQPPPPPEPVVVPPPAPLPEPVAPEIAEPGEVVDSADGGAVSMAVKEEDTQVEVQKELPVPTLPEEKTDSAPALDPFTTPMNQRLGSFDGSHEKVPMSVKERAKHLNKVESESELRNPTTQDGKERRGLGGDDGQSVSSIAITLDSTERKWMTSAAAAEYQALAKLLNKNPHLARRRDFVSTALHWAAKHGQGDVVKLLCGTPGVESNVRSGYTPLHLAAMHGHEHIIELLVQTYDANPNLRDYSGKKPKQYLRNSASSRAQQLLQARRSSSTSGGVAFRRVGSYNSKVRNTAQSSGINVTAAIRNSWASNSRSPTPSPNPSPRESPAMTRKGSLPKVERDLMPPPKGAPPRTKRGRRRENHSDSELPGSDSDRETRERSLPAAFESGV